jgi:N6-L-threonylcarbamoyladenine synthase/protein kinase Bud32
MAAEARLLGEARRQGVPTPTVRDLDPYEATLVLEPVGDHDLRTEPTTAAGRAVARELAALHDAGIVHGDPTVRNVRVGTTASGERTYLIDFGLGYYSHEAEDHAMDLHVFAQSLEGTADDAETLIAAARDAYEGTSADATAVFERLRSIEGRGRYR